MISRRVRHSASRIFRVSSLAMLGSLAVACGGDDEEATGELSVLLQPEATITNGLEPGDELENIRDGWTVSFDKYLVAIGGVKVGDDADHIAQASDEFLVVDLKKTSPAGEAFVDFSGLEARRHPYFGYSLVHAHDAERDGTVSQEDYDEMVAADATFLIEGTLSKAGGESCPPNADECRSVEEIRFRLVVPNEVEFGPCELEGIPGVAVVEDSTAAVGVTLHGDHLFFTAFPVGPEVLERRAQWLANADLDGDDQVDFAELAQITGTDLATLFPSAQYDLGGWHAFEIESAADFARAQLATQGHYQGEGECVWTIDGVSGEHDHDH
jgi:hypothetical protein